MRLALVSFGSRGDLEPLIPIAQNVMSQGHSVVVVGNSEIMELAEIYSIPCRDLGVNVRQLLSGSEGQALTYAKSSSASLKVLSGMIQSQLFDVGKKLFQFLTDVDGIIVNERYYVLAQAVADALHIPILQICFQPKGPTSAYPYPYFSAWFFRFFSNKKTHSFVDKTLLKRFLVSVNRLRTEVLNLAPISVENAYKRKLETPMIQGYSPAVCPPPSDWPTHFQATGYWHIQQKDTSLPEPLLSFLNEDPKKSKIGIGFGSMLYPVEILKEKLIALSVALDIKIVWILNWADSKSLSEGELTPNIYVVSSCSHDALLPCLDLLIHHGGAGTTAAALRHGVPQLIYWFMLDQQFWAGRIQELVCGLNGGCFHHLADRSLTQTTHALLSVSNYKEKSATLATILKNENGPKIASQKIIEYFSSAHVH